MAGVDGDWYLNTTTYEIFHKESGIWVSKGIIKGAKGDPGTGLYIGLTEPSPPYAGMLWIQAQTIYLRDNSNTVWYQVYPPLVTAKVRAHMSVAQNVPNATQTKILYNAEDFDILNNFINARFTATVQGYYEVTASVSFMSSFIQIAYIYILKNGSTWLSQHNSKPNTTPNSIMLTDLVFLNVGDYIEMWVAQMSGSTQQFNIGLDTYLTIRKI